jgi:glycosyltransferase involved in cell wall biosynthesis
LESEDFEAKCGALYSDYKLTKYALMQLFLYLFRRLIFTLTIVFFGSSTYLQAFVILASSYLNFMYLIMVQPFDDPNTAKFEIFNEFTILIVSYGMLVFCDYITSDEVRYNFGWFLTALVLLNILVNFLNVMIKTYFTIRDMLKKYWGKLKKWYSKKVKKGSAYTEWMSLGGSIGGANPGTEKAEDGSPQAVIVEDLVSPENNVDF